MLIILNKLTFQKKLKTNLTNYVFWDKQIKTQQQQNKKSNIKIFAGAREFYPGSFASKVDALGLHHRVN